MTERVLIDTGPMVALFSEEDGYHQHCSDALTALTPPLFTCWPVVTEAARLLRKRPDTLQKLFHSFDGGLFALLTLDAADLPAVAALMKRYESSGLQFADAVLAHLAERENIRTVFTTDRRDFSIIRLKRNRMLKLLPEVQRAASSPCPPTRSRPSPAARCRAISARRSAWLLRTPSPHTRIAYEHDLNQFLSFAGIAAGACEHLPQVRPEHVAAWREQLSASGQTNSTIRRKLTALRSLFSYLQTYGYSGANPAHGKFVAASAVPRDGKMVALSPHDCRRLLDAPQGQPELATPVDRRDRAMLAVLAYSGCRVGELVRLRVRDYKTSGEHRILNVTGKGGKERTTPLHLEAVERLAQWLAEPGIKDDPARPLLNPRTGRRHEVPDPPPLHPRSRGRHPSAPAPT